jgi:hypothetical protein
MEDFVQQELVPVVVPLQQLKPVAPLNDTVAGFGAFFADLQNITYELKKGIFDTFR